MITEDNTHTHIKDGVTYRILTEKSDFDQVVDLQKTIWGMGDVDVMPAHAMMAFAHAGGVTYGAEVDNRLIGCAVAFPAHPTPNSAPILWSEFAGTHPAYQGRGIGFHIKHIQHLWAAEHGYSAVHWTFDPLQRRNANFNLNILPATSSHFIVNAYGYMQDNINAGMPSDRLEAHWSTTHKTPFISHKDRTSMSFSDHIEEAFLLRADHHGQPVLKGLQGSRYYFVEIPSDIAQLKRDNISLAREWQEAVRHTMQAAFAQGYTAIKFTSHKQRCFYILEKS